MVKRIIAIYSDEEHAELNRIKEESGMSWEKFIQTAARQYQAIAEGVN